MIEDSDNGIEAANKAGIYAIGYRNLLITDQTLKNADLIIKDYNKLKKYIVDFQ